MYKEINKKYASSKISQTTFSFEFTRLSTAKQYTPDAWLHAKYRSIKDNNLIPKNIKEAFTNEIQRRKNVRAKERETGQKKKVKGRGGIKMMRNLTKVLTGKQTDQEILSLDEAKLPELVWSTWFKGEQERAPIETSSLPPAALQPLRVVRQKCNFAQ